METPSGVNPEICAMTHKILDTRINAVEEEQQGVREDIKEVRDLQTKILYAIIGLFGASILTLMGVIAGRALDFKVFFP